LTAGSTAAVDTSVAIPLLVASHPDHTRVLAWAKGRTLRLSGHALVETYAVLTRLPGDARLAATDATMLIDENFKEPLLLSARGVRNAHRELASRGVVVARPTTAWSPLQPVNTVRSWRPETRGHGRRMRRSA